MTTWPPPGLFGLYVDCGHYDHRKARWLRYPAADFTCRYGCSWAASGAVDVARFTKTITAYHSEHCPGPPADSAAARSGRST